MKTLNIDIVFRKLRGMFFQQVADFHTFPILLTCLEAVVSPLGRREPGLCKPSINGGIASVRIFQITIAFHAITILM